MNKEYKLEVEKRETNNRKNLKSLRKEGKIPGIYYSYDSEKSLSFFIEKSIINQAIKSESNLFSINVGGKDRTVLFKSVQYHPVTDEMIHIDLYGVNMNKEVVVKVPINLVGISSGVKEEGGVINQASQEIEVRCLPGDIPNIIDINVESLAIGDTILAGSINLDENLELVSSSEMLIVSVTLPMQDVQPAEEESEDEEDQKTDSSSQDSSEDSDKNESDGNSNES
ncbi:MAG: 50S ribosomal protein L25 [Candidatus Marinimicrobia bacterium]|nr:50S ribosomal protein L25 [Candidatus Neomarinimicrobiota bacterium]|tara:strand:- start:1962 stop:2639 length:678 start_codon:yes stop_codon:yes gene_type:complete